MLQFKCNPIQTESAPCEQAMQHLALTDIPNARLFVLDLDAPDPLSEDGVLCGSDDQLKELGRLWYEIHNFSPDYN